MKFFFIVSLLLRVLCKGIVLNVESSQEILSKAFENVSRHLFQLETRMFINNYGMHSDEITSIILENLNENAMPFQLKNLRLDSEKILLDSSTLLTFSNFSSVRNFNQKLFLNNEFFKPLQLFVYSQDATFADIDSLRLDVAERAENNKIREEVDIMVFNEEFERRHEVDLNSQFMDIIQYEYFLVDETNFIKLLTFVWFSPGICGELTLIELNRFEKTEEKWENENFSMKKSENLHGCKISVHQSPEAFDFIQLRSEIFWTLLHFMNTTFVRNDKRRMNSTPSDKRVDVINSFGCFNALDRYRYKKNNSSVQGLDIDFITFPYEYLISRMMAGSDPPEYYSEYDKLLMAFDDFTWVLILLFFVAAFAVILVLKCVGRSTRDFIIGENVRSPSLNVLKIFFGVSLVALPKRNFARYLMMIFILYCLIIRTAWQAMMYEFMQKDIEKPGINTIEEMIESGFSFIMEENFTEKYPESEIAKSGQIISEWILEPMHTACQITSHLFLENEQFRKYPEIHLKQTKKPDLPTVSCGFKFPRHHLFFETIDYKLQQIFTNGILWHPNGEDRDSTQFPSLNLKRFRKHESPKVLNLKMLEAGFVIWTSSLLLSVAAFVVEWIATFMNFLIMKYVLKAFYKTRSV